MSEIREYGAMSDHVHDWNLGSGWALWIDRSMPRGQDAWWFRDCSICRRIEWRRKLPDAADR